MKLLRLNAGLLRLSTPKTDCICYIFRLQKQMGSVRIRIIWRSEMGNSGHGEYMTYEEFMKLVGKTPQELILELNSKHPGIYHSIQIEPCIAS